MRWLWLWASVMEGVEPGEGVVRPQTPNAISHWHFHPHVNSPYSDEQGFGCSETVLWESSAWPFCEIFEDAVEKYLNWREMESLRTYIDQVGTGALELQEGRGSRAMNHGGLLWLEEQCSHIRTWHMDTVCLQGLSWFIYFSGLQNLIFYKENITRTFSISLLYWAMF